MWTFIIVLLCIAALLGGLIWYNWHQFKQSEINYPPKGRFVTVEGVQLHYISKGSGTPVVFLHGGVLTCNDFEQVMNIAADEGYQAIAFDRPGYGNSQRPLNEPATPIEQARLIHAALKKLGIKRPIIVGHSWSGTMVLSYALHYPQDVAGIVMLGAAMYKEGYPAENGDPISKVVTTPVIGNLLLNTVLRSPLGTELADRVIEATFAPEPIPAGYREATRALWLRPGQFRANREDILTFPPASAKLSPQYKEIKTPVVIIVGSEDPFGTVEQASRLKKDIPHAVLEVLPQIAHMIPQNHPKVVIEAINTLIKLPSIILID